MFVQVLTAAITAIDDFARYDLGAETIYKHATYGWQRYRYIRSRGSLAAGLLCMQETGTDKWECILGGASTPNIRVRGLCTHTITTAYYGWVLCQGHFLGESDGSTTADTVQIAAANGRMTDGTAVTSEGIVWALATEDPAGAGGTFLCYIDC